MAIVYQHRRNDTNEVFYVGIGASEKRAYKKRDRTNHWNNVVNKVGYTVEITHRDIIWEEACAIERYLIAFYGRSYYGEGTLVNLTEGGEGVLGLKQNIETIKKVANQKKMPILQYDLEGNFIKEWPSCIDASRTLKIGNSRIADAIKGIKNSAGGYMWRYKDKDRWFPAIYTNNRYSEDAVRRSNENSKKPILQYSLSGEFIKEWKSGVDFCVDNNFPYKSSGFISSCCKGKVPTAYGFKWKYKNVI